MIWSVMPRFLLAAAVLILRSVTADPASAQAQFEVYNKANSPLPDNSVRAIAISETGDKWIGTDFGLAAIRSSGWEVFQTGTSPLPENDIRSLASNGNVLWIGTFSSGVVCKTGNTWAHFHTTNSGLPANHVRSIVTDFSGNVWMGTTGGLTRFSPADSSWAVWKTSNSPLISNHITSVFVAHDSSIYAGTLNGGLAHYSNSTFRIFTTSNSVITDNTILTISETSDGKLLLGSSASGLIVLHHDSVFSYYSPQNSGILTSSVLAVATTLEGTILAGSDISGLNLLYNNSWQNLNTINSLLPSNVVQSLAVDAQNQVWIGTATGGLAVTNLATATLRPESTHPNFLIYPNPTAKNQPISFTNVLPGSLLTITDIHGRNIIHKRITTSDFTLSGYNLPVGVYVIQVQHNSALVRQKLVLTD